MHRKETNIQTLEGEEGPSPSRSRESKIEGRAPLADPRGSDRILRVLSRALMGGVCICSVPSVNVAIYKWLAPPFINRYAIHK